MPSEVRPWPSFGTEALPWDFADDGFGPGTGPGAHRGPYLAALPATIHDADLRLAASTVAMVAEASAEIARFNDEAAGSTTSFAPLLLRIEAASSSRIEDLSASASAIASAELGREGVEGADQFVANIATMTVALASAQNLDVDAILRMHTALIGPHLPAHAGRWRLGQVWVGGTRRSPHGADFVAPRHELVPAAMDDLAEFIRRDDLPPLAQAAVAHAQFENIHPFLDGNGCTGRALLHAIWHRALVRRSIIPISAGLLADTGRYFQALDAYRDGDPSLIVEVVAGAVIPALAGSRELISELTTARTSWGERISARRGASAWGLADLLLTRPAVNARLVADALAVTPANAQLAIDRLVEDGVLTQVGDGARDRVWESVEVLEAIERFNARTQRGRP